jgi:hypothetical protein
MNGRAALGFWLRFLRRSAVGLVLLYAAVALTLGGTPAARPAWYGLTAAWLAWVAWSARRGWEWGRWSEVVAANVALALVLGEGSLQLLAAATHTALVGDDLDGFRLIPGHDYGDGLIGNRRGYPGPDYTDAKRPGVLRIAALGDSFAVGPAVPFADNYLTRLAAQLPGVEVANFGVSGAGPREYRHVLETDGWAVDPDLVLVSVFVGNDITETLPRPRHLDPRRHALHRACTRGWRLVRERWRTPGEDAPAGAGRLAAPPLSPQTFREVEARRLAVCLKEPSPALEKKWRQALAELGRIVSACRRRGVPVAVVLIPDEFQVSEAVLANALADAGLLRDCIDLEGPQRRLLAYFAEQDVPCLDLLPALRACPACYAVRDTHWNVAGNHLTAREIAAWLVRRRLVNTGSG